MSSINIIEMADGYVSDDIPFPSYSPTLFYIWSGADATNAPSDGTGNTGRVPTGAIGFDSDGASNGNVYVYDRANDTWRDTTQSVAGFFGV